VKLYVDNTDDHNPIRETKLVGACSASQQAQAVTNYYGIFFNGDDTHKKFWRITCPCGIEVTYPINGLPEVDTPHPCGNPNHWSVKYKKIVGGGE
jgi:hypothetical protein